LDLLLYWFCRKGTATTVFNTRAALRISNRTYIVVKNFYNMEALDFLKNKLHNAHKEEHVFASQPT
jgi:hypothetical protein